MAKRKITLTSDDVGTLDATSMLKVQPNSEMKETVTMSNETDCPVIEATETLRKVGRAKGTKILNIVKAADFVPKYRELVAAGKNLDEIAAEFKLGKMTIVQKRLSYNKSSAEAGYALNLPLPVSTGTRGGKKIDWAAFTKKVEETVNS